MFLYEAEYRMAALLLGDDNRPKADRLNRLVRVFGKYMNGFGRAYLYGLLQDCGEEAKQGRIRKKINALMDACPLLEKGYVATPDGSRPHYRIKAEVMAR